MTIKAKMYNDKTIQLGLDFRLNDLDPRIETGAIIGIAVGVVALIVAVAGVAFFVIKRKNR